MRVAALVGVAACVGAPARAVEKVVLGSPSVPSVTYGNFYMAEKAGFLKQEGLELEILNIDGTGPLMQLLLSGKVPVALANPAWFVIAHQPGKDPPPVKLFYNYDRTSPWVVASLAGGPVTSLAALKGGTLGVPNAGNGMSPVIVAMLNETGLGGGAVKLLTVGAGVPAWLALKNGDVNALLTLKTWRARMETKGFTSQLVPLPPRYTAIPSIGFAARDETIAKNPHMLIGLTRAIAKATIFCDTNPEACVRAFWARFPEQAPPAGSDAAAALAHDVHVIRTNLDDQLRFDDGEKHVMGHYPEAAWHAYIDILHAGGEITKTDLPLDTLYTGRFLAEINDFDATAVKAQAQAQAWKD
jgi:NitT/TauT family transport system substrate-binding protein